MAIEPSADEFPPLEFEMKASSNHPSSPDKTTAEPTLVAPEQQLLTPVKLEPQTTSPPLTAYANPDHISQAHMPLTDTDSTHPSQVASASPHHLVHTQSQQLSEPNHSTQPPASPPQQHDMDNDAIHPSNQIVAFPMEHRPLDNQQTTPPSLQPDLPLPDQEHLPNPRNLSRRRVPPERLSPSLDQPRPLKICKRVECGAIGVRNLYKGPDGPSTLCYNCYMKYRALRLVVYMHLISGHISIAPHPGMTAMRVLGFEPRSKDGSNDLSRPRLVQLEDKEEDHELLARSQMRGMQSRVRKRRRGTPQATGERQKRRRLSQPRPLAEGLKDGEGVYVKAEWRSDLRRFRVPIGVSLHAFREEVRRVFQWKREQLFCITFRDEYGDYVRLGEQSKMARMFETAGDKPSSVVRVRIVS